jgi:hypothetical protein
VARSACHRGTAPKEAPSSCRTLDWISAAVGWTSALLDERGDHVDVGAAPPDRDGLRGFARGVVERHGPVEVRAAIESMNGARFVHDTLERCGGQVEVADAQKVKGLAPLACKTDRIDAWVLAELSRRELVPAIWLPGFEQRAERERAPLAAVPGQKALVAQAPRPRAVARVRAHLPGLGPRRPHRPRAARPPGVPRAMAREVRAPLMDQPAAGRYACQMPVMALALAAWARWRVMPNPSSRVRSML